MKRNHHIITCMLVLVMMTELTGCFFNASEPSTTSIPSIPSIPSQPSVAAASITAPTVLDVPSTENALPELKQTITQAEPEPSDYMLEIKGKSNQLTPKALKSMTLWRENIIALAQKHRDSIYINGPDRNKVALTFDDGPDPVNTPAIIDSLKKYKVKGSFFFVGEMVKSYPEVVRHAYDNGNLVLNHSYKHDNLTQKSQNQIQADLNQTDKAIEDIIGKKPALMRSPYGETDEKVVAAATDTGHKIVLWSIDTLDWSQRESQNITKNVIDNIRNGDIILMHSTSRTSETAKAVPIIIEELQKRNYDIVDLATLLNVQAYQ
ncbi:Peptidoglycan/xylan/chitin deacetylase, PgdA/CDA1 family [Paenibacillus sp. 1_12]|uniref:polysaccharide deacetylase family protein n=1 Tax=Paenibacillus sp. 1_12 TaxID=1566278 RepID=UPI0008DF27C5|nr:polysaccharide deacetylase family protein [Paenibacillus sp. 1_12]SFK98610.1 Peptidoglycan/xylan/chitin deacetylase, PgdA/CDA1 family [Paenibacillus sp. 1_12]